MLIGKRISLLHITSWTIPLIRYCSMICHHISRKKGGVTMSMVLNSVYNNYLTVYAPTNLTRYDTHKKSELRNVYNSIVKINKDAPWYLPTTSQDAQQYAVNLKENARQLHNTIAQLGGLEEQGLLSKKCAFSSNEGIATAVYIGPTDADEEAAHFNMEVQSLANSQENMGLYLEDTPVTLAPGSYSFDLSINDMNYEFQFSIGETETNKALQERLAKLINNANIGITATVAEEENRTSLRLTSDTTGLPLGKNHIFTVSDTNTSKASGTVAYLGLDYVSRQASNAQFLVNGEMRHASSNHFTVGKLYEIELKGTNAEGETIEIGLKPDLESLTENISHLISGYNSFIKAASSYLESQSRSRKLVQEMRGIADTYQQPMRSMGLQLQEDGTMTLNQRTLIRAARESENLTETFDYIKDFSGRLLHKSDQVSLNPMNYVDRTIVAYKNPGHTYPNPYATSDYTGMLFNGYC